MDPFKKLTTLYITKLYVRHNNFIVNKHLPENREKYIVNKNYCCVCIISTYKGQTINQIMSDNKLMILKKNLKREINLDIIYSNQV